VRPVRKADNHTAIYEPSVLKMWEKSHDSIGVYGLLEGSFNFFVLSN
jgi:hypothetical protein